METGLSHRCKENVKITLVISDLGGGGTQRVLSKLVEDFLHQGYSLTVVTLASTDNDVFPLPNAVKRYCLDAVSDSGSLIEALIANCMRVRTLRRQILSSKPEVVVSFITATNILTLLACLGTGLKVVVSERNDPAKQPIGLLWSGMRVLLYRFARAVVCNSKTAVSSLSQYVKKDRLFYIPNSFDPIRTLEPAGEKAVVSEKTILSVGRLHNQKNYETALRAFAASGLREEGFKYVILGEGPERSMLKSLSESLGIETSVRFAGFTDNVGRWYGSAHCFLMTSKYEGTPNAVIEALSYGLPVVISSTAGDGPLLVQETGAGIVYDGDDEHVAASALQTVCRDVEKWSAKAEAGKHYVNSYFSRSRISTLWRRVITD